MAFELPSLPSFQTNIPQMPSALDQYGKMLQLKALSGQIQQQQQIQPLQVEQAQKSVEAQTLENQQRQQELDSQKAMIKAWSDPDFLKGFTGTDKANASGVGFDPDALTASLISKGVLPKDAMAMTSSFVDRSAKIADTLKAQAQTGEANAAQRDKGMKILADKIGGVLDLPAAKAGAALAALKQDLVQNPQAYAGVPKDDLAHVYGADLEHLPAMATLIGLDSKIADFHKSKAEATTAEQKVIPASGGLSPDTKQQVAKEVAVATNPQVQAGKEEVAAAEGRAKQLMQGLAEPVYAMDAQGNKILTSKTTALQAKAPIILPVTEKQVSDDTMLINRLGDVHQKIAQYEENLAGLGTKISAVDQSNIAALIGKGKVSVGAFGTSLPMDRLNAVLDKENISNLSEPAKKLLVSYYNARESMQGYQRVLSGTGRANEKAMELNLDALPNPGTADASYAAESLSQFKQNLAVVGQGLPKIPGVKSPEEWAQQPKQVTPSEKKTTTKASKYGVEIQ